MATAANPAPQTTAGSSSDVLRADLKNKTAIQDGAEALKSREGNPGGGTRRRPSKGPVPEQILKFSAARTYVWSPARAGHGRLGGRRPGPAHTRGRAGRNRVPTPALRRLSCARTVVSGVRALAGVAVRVWLLPLPRPSLERTGPADARAAPGLCWP
jgi:hypothetical protein